MSLGPRHRGVRRRSQEGDPLLGGYPRVFRSGQRHRVARARFTRGGFSFGSGSGFQPAMMRAHFRAWAVLTLG
ncbi:MAG TPA: hypothetical protein VFL55_04405, partial [Acetobacteraceae bacterium]|nr:hypothetical protein [Acetobacteraceae bacterium]